MARRVRQKVPNVEAKAAEKDAATDVHVAGGLVEVVVGEDVAIGCERRQRNDFLPMICSTAVDATEALGVPRSR